MPQEIERKFLVPQAPPDLHSYHRIEILQGYVTTGDAEVEVRIRKKGKNGYLTVKTGSGLERDEVEIEITPSQFDELWPLTESRRIRKVRYDIPYRRQLIELDVYLDSLDGLITAEVEFRSRSQSAAFEPPAWMGREVTEDGRFMNRNLAIAGIPKDALFD